MRHRVKGQAMPVTPCGQVYRKLDTQPDSAYVAQLPLYSNSGLLTNFPYSYHQETWDELHEGPPYKEGGPFNSWTWWPTGYTVQNRGVFTSKKSGVYRYQYRGGFNSKYQPTYSDFGVDLGVYNFMKGSSQLYADRLGTTTWGDVSSNGAQAWAKYRPGKSGADGGVFFGEIRDIPRTLKTTARWFQTRFQFDRAFRNEVTSFQRDVKTNLRYAGDSWLTIQFGWLPFLRDLQNFYKTWKKLDAIISYIVRNNGRWIKREGVVYEPVNTDDIIRDQNLDGQLTSVFINPTLGDIYYPAWPTVGRRLTTRVTCEECWFEALFRYWIPESKLESVQWRKRTIQKLFGFELTPAMVWNLIPWSWLIDWFTNVGDVLENISGNAVDNLVAKYAYVMGRKNTVITDKHLLALDPPVVTSHSWTLKRQQRTAANPFGFGLAYSDLTSKQWSILGALGLGRIH